MGVINCRGGNNSYPLPAKGWKKGGGMTVPTIVGISINLPATAIFVRCTEHQHPCALVVDVGGNINQQQSS
eukprot:scaffold10274_cov88-Skeletonema_dohrnii-CCMP3373.AAC.6